MWVADIRVTLEAAVAQTHEFLGVWNSGFNSPVLTY